MSIMLAAILTQTLSSSAHIQASPDPAVGKPFAVALGRAKISGLVHRAEIVDFDRGVFSLMRMTNYLYCNSMIN